MQTHLLVPFGSGGLRFIATEHRLCEAVHMLHEAFVVNSIDRAAFQRTANLIGALQATLARTSSLPNRSAT